MRNGRRRKCRPVFPPGHVGLDDRFSYDYHQDRTDTIRRVYRTNRDEIRLRSFEIGRNSSTRPSFVAYPLAVKDISPRSSSRRCYYRPTQPGQGRKSAPVIDELIKLRQVFGWYVQESITTCLSEW